MSNRSLTSTVRSVGRLNAWRSQSSGFMPRLFSTSPVHGVKAIFVETENSKLNAILKTIQETIIFPAYLPEKQRQLVFNPKMKSQLEQNPVVIEVEGLEHRFSPIDRFKGVENSKKILNKALDSMDDSSDWNNLATLLAGYKKAGIQLKANNWGRIVRMAGKKGQIYAVIECAKEVEKTGLLLTNRELVVRVLAYNNEKITNSNWGLDETKQAQKWSELVLDLIQRPEHSIEGQPTRERLHFSRAVRGMILFTRASVVKVKQAAGEDAESNLTLLRDEVELFNSLWKDSVNENLAEVADFAQLNPTAERETSSKGVKVPKALNGSSYVQVVAQGIKGISLAREVLGEEAESLAPVEVALSEHLRQFVKTAKSPTEGWDQKYEDVIGQAPGWQMETKG